MGTAVVPWTDSFELDEGLFRDEITGLLSAYYTNLYIFGTAGEGYVRISFDFRHRGKLGQRFNQVERRDDLKSQSEAIPVRTKRIENRRNRKRQLARFLLIEIGREPLVRAQLILASPHDGEEVSDTEVSDTETQA